MKIKIILTTLIFMCLQLCIKVEKLIATPYSFEISYECIGQDSFLVKLTGFRNCQGSSWGNVLYVHVNSACGSFNFPLERDTFTDISHYTLCQSQCSRCVHHSNCFDYGAQKHVYYGILDVSSINNCCEIKLSYSRCCRFGADFVNNSTSSTFYTETLLNSCVTPCNNSPRFENPAAVVITCKDQDFIYDPLITETDGDSLSIFLTSPLYGNHNNNFTLNYISGFSKYEPFPYMGKLLTGPNAAFPFGYHFDTLSGKVMFRPVDSTGSTIISILVKEYRDTQLISSVRRDIDLIVVDCPNNKAPEFPMQSPLNLCLGDSLYLNIQASDPDSTGSNPDSVFINWVSGHENAVFVSNPGSVYAEAVIKWLPDSSDIGKHTFHLVAFDNGCPVSARSSQLIEVNVHPPPEISYAFEKVCDKVMFSAVNHANQTTSFHWTGNAGLDTSKHQFDFYYPDTGTYHFNLEAITNHCGNISIKDSVVFSEPRLSVEINPEGTLKICADTIVTLNAITTNATVPVHYLWNNGDSSETVSYEVAEGDAFFFVEARDSNGCFAASDTVFIKFIDLPEPVNETYTFCHGEEETIYGIDPAFDHKWYNSDGLLIGDSDSLILRKAGKYVHEIEVKTIDFCSVKDTFEVITLLPDTPYVEDITACRGENVSLIAESSVSNLHWYDAALGVLLSVDGRYDFNAVSSKDFVLHSFIESNRVQCGLEQVVSLEVLESPIVDFTVSSRCVGDSIQFINKTTYSEGIETLNHYWEFGFNEGTSSLIEPVYLYQNSGLYQVNLNVSAPNGCESYSSRMIEILDLPYAGFSYDVDFAKVRFTPENVNYISYHWDFGDGNSSTEVFPEHEYSEKGEYVVILKVEDVNGCMSDDTMLVDISSVSTELIEIKRKLKPKIYPNPFDNWFTVEFAVPGKRMLKLYSVDGKLIWEIEHDGSEIVKINVSLFPQGIYLLKIMDNKQVFTFKLAKIN